MEMALVRRVFSLMPYIWITIPLSNVLCMILTYIDIDNGLRKAKLGAQKNRY